MDTLIILHGWQSSKEKWQKVKELTETQNLRVVALDLPGFKPENQLDKSWNLDNYVSWLKNVLENFSNSSEPFFILGHSFGGRIAIKFASKYPKKLKGLILVSAAGIKKEKTFRDKVLLKTIKLAKKLGVQEQASQTKGLWQIIRRVFYRYVLRQADYLKANPIQKEIMKSALKEDLKPLLADIVTPTLIVWGAKDKITLLKDAYLMKEKIKNSQLEIIDNIGHTPHFECPEILAKKIKNFIQS